jgi:hypothetical protein
MKGNSIKTEQDTQMLFDASEQLLKSFNNSEQHTDDNILYNSSEQDSYFNNNEVDEQRESESKESITTTTVEVVKIIRYLQTTQTPTTELLNKIENIFSDIDEFVKVYNLLKKPNRLKIIFFIQTHKITYPNEIASFFGIGLTTVLEIFKDMQNNSFLSEIRYPDQTPFCRNLINDFSRIGYRMFINKIRFFELAQFAEKYRYLLDLFVAKELSPIDIEKIKNFKRLPELQRKKIEAKRKIIKSLQDKERLEHENLKKEFQDFQKLCMKECLEKDLKYIDFIDLISSKSKEMSYNPLYLLDWKKELKRIVTLEGEDSIKVEERFNNLKNSWKRNPGV